MCDNKTMEVENRLLTIDYYIDSLTYLFYPRSLSHFISGLFSPSVTIHDITTEMGTSAKPGRFSRDIDQQCMRYNVTGSQAQKLIIVLGL